MMWTRRGESECARSHGGADFMQPQLVQNLRSLLLTRFSRGMRNNLKKPHYSRTSKLRGVSETSSRCAIHAAKMRKPQIMTPCNPMLCYSLESKLCLYNSAWRSEHIHVKIILLIVASEIQRGIGNAVERKRTRKKKFRLQNLLCRSFAFWKWGPALIRRRSSSPRTQWAGRSA